MRSFIVLLLAILSIGSVYAAVTPFTPLDGAWTTDTTPDFTFRTDASASCTLLVDGIAYGTVSAQANAATAITANAPLGQGERFWQVSCDGTASESQLLYVDTAAPAVMLSRPNTGAELDERNVNVTFTMMDNIDSTINYTIFLNGIANITGAASSGSQRTVTLRIPDGSHSIVVQGADDAGNAANSSTAVFTVNTTVVDDRRRLPTLSSRPEQVSIGIGFNRYPFLIDRKVHYLNARSADEGLELFFTPSDVSVVLPEGEERNLDITGDQVVDVYIKLLSYTSNDAMVEIGVPQAMAATIRDLERTLVPENDTEIAENESEAAVVPVIEATIEDEESNWLWWALGTVLLLGLIWWFWPRPRHKF